MYSTVKMNGEQMCTAKSLGASSYELYGYNMVYQYEAIPTFDSTS